MNLARRMFLVSSIVTALCLAGAPSAHADEVVLLLNKRNPTKKIPRGKVSSMFLGNTAFWHGVVPVKLVVRGDKSPAAAAFYEPVVQMSGSRFDAYWTSRQLAGQGVKPDSVDAVDAAIELVKKSPGAISFALKSELEGKALDGVKVIPLP